MESSGYSEQNDIDIVKMHLLNLTITFIYSSHYACHYTYYVYDYEYTDADNLDLLRTKVITTTSNATVKKSKKKKVSAVQARDMYYRRVLKRQDSYEERRDFFEPEKKMLFESK